MPHHSRRPTGGPRPRIAALPLLALLVPGLIAGCGATPSRTPDKIDVAASAVVGYHDPAAAPAPDLKPLSAASQRIDSDLPDASQPQSP
jgi:hypothetical protein